MQGVTKKAWEKSWKKLIYAFKWDNNANDSQRFKEKEMGQIYINFWSVFPGWTNVLGKLAIAKKSLTNKSKI